MDTLCYTLTSCLDDICPAWAAPSKSWLSDVLREYRTNLRAAEKKWCKSKDPSDLSKYQTLLSSLSAEVRTAKSSYFHNKINSAPDTRNLFKTFYSLQLDFILPAFNYLLCHPPPPPTTSIIADDIATFVTEKTRTIGSQFSPPSNHIHCSNSHLLLLSPHWSRSIQTSPLQPSYNMPSRLNPHTPSPSNLSHTLTSTHTHH